MATVAEPKVQSPSEGIQRLKEGNRRFYSNQQETKVIDAYSRRQQIVTQTPFAVVLGCSDSRVPVEIVFDQGPGDLFVVRVAGNVAETSALATVEFAVRYLQIKVILVLGHQGCAAVQMALKPWVERQNEPRLVRELVDAVVPAMRGVPQDLDPREKIQAAVQQNVLAQVEKLSRDDAIAEQVRAGELIVAGAYYEIETGKVQFL
jgi:carbonic anhydrase